MAQIVTIDGKEYQYSYDYGAMLSYERIANTNKIPEGADRLRSVTLHYCCLVHNDNFTMSLAEFVHKLDTQIVIDQLNDALNVEYARWSGTQAIQLDESSAEGEGNAEKAHAKKK